MQLRKTSSFFRARAYRRSMCGRPRARDKGAAHTHLDVAAPDGTAIAKQPVVGIRDLALSAAAIVVLVALIVLTDDRVRERVVGVSSRTVSHGLVDGTTRMESATVSLRDRAMDNAPLTF